MSAAIKKYQNMNFQANIENINAYKVIQALMNNALDKIAKAVFFINTKKIAEKGLNISLAITTIDALQASLDMDKGGEMAANLAGLYEYMLEKLLVANLNNDVTLLDEVGRLLSTIKSGWDGVEAEALKIINEDKTQG